MKTSIYQPSDLERKDVQEHIKNTINHHGVVVFPTETVYGIGANAFSDEAIKKIYKIKGRPSDNPLIVHLSETAEIYQYIHDLPTYASILMNAFWPGPLTLIFNNHGKFSNTITGGLDTVAIRVPSHPIARQIIKLSGVPICAPSANISGRPSSTLFSHVKDDFDGRVPIIIDGGPTEIGLESTVLDLTEPIPTILRPGKITQEMIEDILKIKILNGDVSSISSPKSPGMKYKHYAPKGTVTLVDGSFDRVVSYLTEQSKNLQEKVAILCPNEFAKHLYVENVYSLGSIQNLETIGENLFKFLRLMDDLNIDSIFVPVIDSKGYGLAIMNRLLKAANHRIIKLS